MSDSEHTLIVVTPPSSDAAACCDVHALLGRVAEDLQTLDRIWTTEQGEQRVHREALLEAVRSQLDALARRRTPTGARAAPSRWRRALPWALLPVAALVGAAFTAFIRAC